MKGEGDHTYLETIIIEHEDYIKYQKLENKLKDVEKLFTPETDDEEIVEEEEAQGEHHKFRGGGL